MKASASLTDALYPCPNENVSLSTFTFPTTRSLDFTESTRFVVASLETDSVQAYPSGAQIHIHKVTDHFAHYQTLQIPENGKEHVVGGVAGTFTLADGWVCCCFLLNCSWLWCMDLN